MTEGSPTRTNKGNSLLVAVNDYVVLDIETTGFDPTYDAIIEISALRISNGNIIDRFQTFVNPGFPVGSFITELTGITDEMLADAPQPPDALRAFLAMVGNSIIVAHNANYDVNMLYEKCDRYLGVSFPNDFVDTLRVSRRLFPQEKRHRLDDITVRLGVGERIAHRAETDAMQTMQCFEVMKQYAADNGISFESLYPVKKSYYRPGRYHLSAKDISASADEIDESTDIFGKVFVFTGMLERMGRKDAMQVVVNMGGLCGDNVTKETNYLVLGNNDYCSTIKDGKSSKHKKAEKLKLSGQDIEIISENVFYDMMG